jgi:hypothetical protein
MFHALLTIATSITLAAVPPLVDSTGEVRHMEPVPGEQDPVGEWTAPPPPHSPVSMSGGRCPEDEPFIADKDDAPTHLRMSIHRVNLLRRWGWRLMCSVAFGMLVWRVQSEFGGRDSKRLTA